MRRPTMWVRTRISIRPGSASYCKLTWTAWRLVVWILQRRRYYSADVHHRRIGDVLVA